LIHKGQEIALERLDLDLTESDTGDMDVFASAYTRARVLGLGPGESDVRVILEREGALYEIHEATVFDLDLPPSGETIVQITGRLRPLDEAADRESDP
jgi:hypothetical protein